VQNLLFTCRLSACYSRQYNLEKFLSSSRLQLLTYTIYCRLCVGVLGSVCLPNFTCLARVGHWIPPSERRVKTDFARSACSCVWFCNKSCSLYCTHFSWIAGIEDEGTAIFRNVRNYSFKVVASHPRSLDSSAKQLWEPQFFDKAFLYAVFCILPLFLTS